MENGWQKVRFIEPRLAMALLGAIQTDLTGSP
jgi:hypothetical protein